MTKKDVRLIDAVRRTQGPIGNHVIDEYVAGRLSRRAFIRRGTIVGLSLPAIGALLAACGDDDEDDGRPPATPRWSWPGATPAGTDATTTAAAPARGRHAHHRVGHAIGGVRHPRSGRS